MADGARRGDLTVTALYTSQVWRWARFADAELFATWRARDVFNATNLALGVARLFRRRLPSLRHGLAQRHAIIDHVLSTSGCANVIELAAGLSRRGATFSQDPDVRYVEVDLPRVVAHKQKLLARTRRGRDVAARDNLRMVAADVDDVDLAALVDRDGSVFVIAEGLLMYLSAERQRRLWARVAALLRARPGSGFAFDLVPFCEQPRPGVVGRTLEAVFKRFTRGETFAFDDRTRDDLVRELADCGLTAELLEPTTAPADWAIPYRDRRTQTLVFACRAGHDADP